MVNPDLRELHSSLAAEIGRQATLLPDFREPRKENAVRAHPKSLALVAALSLALALSGVQPASAGNYHAFPKPYAYWSFDRCDGSDTYDAAVNPHHAKTYNGAYCSSWGRYGRSGWFDGTDNLVEVTGSESINLDRLTVAAWIYPYSTSGTRTIINKWYTLDSWGLFLENGQLVFSVVFPGGTWGVQYRVTATAPPLYTWTHVAGSYDGAYIRLYVNGTQVASQYTGGGNLQDSGRRIAIGSHPSWNSFYGYIDEVKLYNWALGGSQIPHLAAAPSANGIRGVHLMPSQWTCAFDQTSCNGAIVDKFEKDLGIIHSIGNLNSVKTVIFSMKQDTGGSRGFWQARQREKLTYLKSATGNHMTWILRAWPTPADCPPGSSDYYECGRLFATELVDVFNHLKNTLKLQYVYIEVANEPNHPGETVFYDPNPWTTMGRYNDFFRGFYFGQQQVGHNFPLVYAGLTPSCHPDTTCDADLWYKDYWVRNHIQNYASKVGVHVYWDSTNAYDWNGRLSESGGLYYRRVQGILANPGYSPAVSARGLQMTEFNFNRATGGHSTGTQAVQVCDWFKHAAGDAASGYWVEQSTIFVTSTEDGSWQAEYWITDDQLDDIRFCQ